jgi:hypothetical protein
VLFNCRQFLPRKALRATLQLLCSPAKLSSRLPLRRRRRGLAAVGAAVGALLARHVDLVDQHGVRVLLEVREGAVALFEGAPAVQPGQVVPLALLL